MENDVNVRFMEAVAALLDGEWKVETKEGLTGCYLVSENGEELHAHRFWRDSGRLIIAGNLTPAPTHGSRGPYYSDLNHDARQITVSATRPAKAIAGEITRRLLPSYREQQAEWRRRVGEFNASENRRATLTKRLSKVLGVEPRDDGNYVLHLYQSDPYLSGDFTVDSDGEVKVELRGLPIETALKIAELVKA